MIRKDIRKGKWLAEFMSIILAASLMAGCGAAGPGGGAAKDMKDATIISSEADESESSKELYENSEDGGHAILADGETAEYSDIKVEKTGESEGDEADFYGENSAIFATNGAYLTLSDIEVHTNGTHANAVFSYGEGTTVDISNSEIETEGNCSGGLMTTGNGTMNATDLTIHTTGNSSAAIRSDRGGGKVTVTGGDYTTDGTGSPVIYSTADITVEDANLESTASQGVVVEGQNSVTLKDVTLEADNNTKNSDKSDTYQAVMIYQSMSGDADEGTASFTMEGGSLNNANGDIFFVNNTVADINLKDADINNNGDGVFLRAAAAGWGNEGSNGGNVNLKADGQTIEGDLLTDDVSTLNLYLSNGSTLDGAINPEETEGQVYVELKDGAVWTLTGDSHISSLTCDTDSIDLDGHKLYVNGTLYEEGTASEGEAVEAKVSEGGQGGPGGTPPDGNGGPGGQGGPGGESGSEGGPGGTPPDGNG
ncbi:MAG: hypothetical protein K5989_03545, partial [Lachnospiraceae bacterium]|nr:hypothetical protein [Lachnospiraceae bacterium]